MADKCRSELTRGGSLSLSVSPLPMYISRALAVKPTLAPLQLHDQGRGSYRVALPTATGRDQIPT